MIFFMFLKVFRAIAFPGHERPMTPRDGSLIVPAAYLQRTCSVEHSSLLEF